MNNKLALSISQKITIVMLVTYGLVLVGLFFVNQSLVDDLKRNALQHDAEQLAESIVVAADNKSDRARLIRIANSLGASNNVSHLFIVKSDTLSVVASNKNKFIGSSVLTINRLSGLPLTKAPTSESIFIGDSFFYLTHFETISNDGKKIEPLTLIVELNTDDFAKLITNPSRYLLAFALLGFISTIGIIMYTLKLQVFRPLRRLATAISTGIADETPIKVDSYNSKDEIGSLVKEYNLLIEKLTEKQTQLQAETIKSQQAAQSKSDFLAVMSHEIRTPLNGIIGTSTLLEKTPITEQQKEYLTTISSSGSQLLALINNILDYSKLDAGKFELSPKRIEINQFMREVSNLFQITAKEKTLLFNMTLLEHACYTDIDDVRLKQVLINLLGNAFKFTEQGHVSLEVQLIQSDLIIKVSDTGIGLSRKQTEKLFAKFVQADASTTRKYGGTGLGLAICKGVINQMGGTIVVDSVLKHGSEFTISIPIEIKAPPTEVPEEATVCPVSFKKLNILVVDDVPLNRMIAKAMLSQHTITMAEDGLDAIKKVGNETFDIILMDCLMPEMDGFDATRVIRRSNINTPIIALTASTLDEIREECYASGMNDYLTKPLVEKDLLEKVTKWSLHASNH